MQSESNHIELGQRSGEAAYPLIRNPPKTTACNRFLITRYLGRIQSATCDSYFCAWSLLYCKSPSVQLWSENWTLLHRIRHTLPSSTLNIIRTFGAPEGVEHRIASMRLLNTRTLTLAEFHGGASTPPYAILSHTWEDEGEVTFQDINAVPHEELVLRKGKGFGKIQQTCSLACARGIEWAWVDTCCIDKTSSSELTEAINSMFRWYQRAQACFAYLADLEPSSTRENGDSEGHQDEDGAAARGGTMADHESEITENDRDERGSDTGDGGVHLSLGKDDHPAQQVARFAHCRWFTRGWTLQELIAPRRVEFYNRNWQFEGDKSSISVLLSNITRIRAEVLDDADQLHIVPVAQRMSWAATRETKREEDRAYCLLGIFGVNIPLLYGEGEKAFIRLQEEIIKESNDLTLFAWRLEPKLAHGQTYWGILAPSPNEFGGCGDIEAWVDPMHNDECVMTSKGLRVTPNLNGGLRLGEDGIYVMKLQCHRRNRTENLGIFLQQHGCDVYTRVKPDKLAETPSPANDKHRVFYVTKTVSTSQSLLLRTSIRNAINLSRALDTLAGLGITPFSTGSMEPEGHWDGQRGLFLTRGVRQFSCRVSLVGKVYGRHPGLQADMVLACRLSEKSLSVSINAATPGDTYCESLVQPLTVRAVRETVKGQPVYFVEVDLRADETQHLVLRSMLQQPSTPQPSPPNLALLGFKDSSKDKHVVTTEAIPYDE
ncbi:heterokaryon incompatibility protein-domain-containing protein [Chaetomium strumarium]|uniref:Heterokaryon incompatibility protein-domain-containing protein n=1 Tax=Chaetomium strumarium TaxID=1170767 RepID=A0AAJ0LXV6_9PEZI|nr:heterokaryon incompatibility protein-domain-containing protein [Chaetomium strumarium]